MAPINRKFGKHSKPKTGTSLMSYLFMMITLFCLITAYYLYTTPLKTQQDTETSSINDPRQSIIDSIEELELSYLKQLYDLENTLTTNNPIESALEATGFDISETNVETNNHEQHQLEKQHQSEQHSVMSFSSEIIPSPQQKKLVRPLIKEVTKKIVPLSTPQGYDYEKQLLTIGKWQASGVSYDPAMDSPAINQKNGDPAPGLMYKATPKSNEGVVMGLAAYPNDILGKFERFVGTLRSTGYEGHIILGVHPNISPREIAYLKAMDVTYYASDAGPCISPLKQNNNNEGEDGDNSQTKTKSGSGTNYIRGTCSKHYNHLVFEWARYEMALGWIKACPECTGWMLVCDVKDTIFQRSPFIDLPSHTQSDIYEDNKIQPDLFLYEEAFPPPLGFDHNHWFAWGSIKNCFGKEYEKEMMSSYRNKPILCSGSTVGTRKGLLRYLTAITRRYYEMTWLGDDCVPPMAVDQPIHNWLFYTQHGYSNQQIKNDETLKGSNHQMAISMPLGTGVVATIGRLCAMAEKAKVTLSTISEYNLTTNKDGLFLNHDGQLAPVVHQHDRCWSIWQPVLTPYCRKAHEKLREMIGSPQNNAIRDHGSVCRGG